MDQRNDYLSWDAYFMGIAILSAQRSKDPGTQVGACIVDKDNKILSVGYNGMPTGCADAVMPWARDGQPMDTKYLFVCHAERKGADPVRRQAGGVPVGQVFRQRFGQGVQADVPYDRGRVCTV